MMRRRTISYILAFLSLIQLFFAIPLPGEDYRVLTGVSFNEHDLGGMNKEEVFCVLIKENEKIQKQLVILDLTSINQTIETSYQEMGISIDGEKIWQQSVALGRSGTWWENLWKRWQLKREGQEISLQLQVDRKKLQTKLQELTSVWDEKPNDAQLVVEQNNSIKIIPHEEGRAVDVNTAMIEIEAAVLKMPGQLINISLHFIPVFPEKLTSDIEAYNISGLVASFKTSFNAGRINRSRNIEVAANSLNNCLLAPNEVFSFNDTVGPRTIEKGYNEADIILQNELVPGVGGGVCQVSTTLYNAVLRAELEIVERAPHSMIISYVPPGLDATVVYGYRDLKFRNNTAGHIIIKTAIYQGNLEIKIFGKPSSGRKVEIKSTKEKEIFPETIYQEDPFVPKGKYILEREGTKGYIYKVERYIYDNQGKLLRIDTISKDYYPPIDRIIRTSTNSSILSYFQFL